MASCMSAIKMCGMQYVLRKVMLTLSYLHGKAENMCR